MRTEARQARRVRGRLILKRDEVRNDLKVLLRSRIVADFIKREGGQKLPALMQQALSGGEGIGRIMADCWASGLKDVAAGRGLQATLTIHGIADIWIMHMGESPGVDEIGHAAAALSRLSVLNNSIEYLLGDFRDVPGSGASMTWIPDLSLEGEPLMAFSWLETTWSVLLSYAEESDAIVIRELGKRSSCSMLARGAMNALKSRCIAESALEKGLAGPELSFPPLMLEYLAALYVVEDHYPLRAWPREWAEAAQARLRSQGLIPQKEDMMLTESGQMVVERLRLVPRPF